MEVAFAEDFCGFVHGRLGCDGDRIAGHDLFEREGVVQGGIDGAIIGTKGIAEADTQQIAPRNNAF